MSREIISVGPENHMKHINALWGHNVGFFNVKLVVLGFKGLSSSQVRTAESTHYTTIPRLVFWGGSVGCVHLCTCTNCLKFKKHCIQQCVIGIWRGYRKGNINSRRTYNVKLMKKNRLCLTKVPLSSAECNPSSCLVCTRWTQGGGSQCPVEEKAASSSTQLHPDWYHYLGCFLWHTIQRTSNHCIKICVLQPSYHTHGRGFLNCLM